MRNVREFYSNNIELWESKLRQIRKEARNISNLRVLCAILFIACSYGTIKVDGSIGWGLLLITATFLYLVKKSSKLEEIQRLAEITLDVNKREFAFLNGDKTAFESGTDIIPIDHLYAVDLDIFGTGSLFQSVNRSVTFGGRKLLVNDLLNPPMQQGDVIERSELIRELEEKTEWRQQFYAIGSRVVASEKDAVEIGIWAKQRQFYSDRKRWLWIAGLISAISSIVFLYIIVTFDSGFFTQYFIVVTGMIGINSTLMLGHAKDQKGYFHQFGERTKLFENFSALFDHVAKHDLKSPLGRSLHDNTKAAAGAFMQLFKLSNLADQRLNGLMGPLLNGLFCFDVWTIRRIEQWRAKYGLEIEGWLQCLARMDMMNSLANFTFNHPTFCNAVVDSANKSIVATEMGHPLLSVSAVKNDYQVGVTTRAHIITGSNMAGKSTFIRAVGLNVILALNGMPVCATSFSCPVLRIVTCIRITDSLEDDTSYFKAELVRLRHIVDVLGEGIECLVLLDEILKGTNSDDKRNGTMAFYRKLRGYNCLALLATHDLTVGQLESEDPAYFENFCFESIVVDHTLHFDYKLQKGVSKSTNASFLMKGMGLID